MRATENTITWHNRTTDVIDIITQDEADARTIGHHIEPAWFDGDEVATVVDTQGNWIATYQETPKS